LGSLKLAQEKTDIGQFGIGRQSVFVGWKGVGSNGNRRSMAGWLSRHSS